MLSIVSTPIGNLEDITLRAQRKLQECDGIVCEDTRVTGKLLTLLNLPKKELFSLHSYSDQRKVEMILGHLRNGKNLCLVSDAGTPCISDPGFLLIEAARNAGIKIEAVPGPSAFLTALSVSGLSINQFTYLGFLPIKKGRQTLLKSLRMEERTVVFYESPHRILRTLSDLALAFSDQPDRQVVIARELTKMYEEIIRTSVKDISEITKILTVKGEFVVVLEGRK